MIFYLLPVVLIIILVTKITGIKNYNIAAKNTKGEFSLSNESDLS